MPSKSQVANNELEQLTAELLAEHAVTDDYGDWDYAGTCIIKAGKNQDMEMLRAYQRLLKAPFSNANVGEVTHVVLFLARNGYSSDTATLDLVEALKVLERELARRTISIMVAQYYDPRHDPLRLVLLENRHRSEMLLNIVRTRNITDHARMRDLLDEMDAHHSAMADGTL